jgi:trk system potassium uptake protein
VRPSRVARAGCAVLPGPAAPCCMVPVHVVIVGCGRVGSGLATRLVEHGHTVSIIDKVPRAFRRLPADWPGTSIVGSGFDRDDLDRAGAKQASALAAVTSGDNSNILTARIARENYGIHSVVARIYDPRRAEIYQRLGIPTVATVTWTIDQVMHRLLPDAVVGEWSDPSGHLVLVERVLPESWAGKALRDLGMAGKVKVVAVTRAGIPRLEVADLVGQEGDVLHLAVLKDAVGELEHRFDGGTGLADGRAVGTAP